MGGTIINVVAVLLGSTLGLLIGNRLPDKIQSSVVTGLGLVTVVVGIDNALLSGNIIIPLLATVIGVILGELADLDGRLNRLGAWLQKRFVTGADVTDVTSARERFITGFVTASLVFCVGPLTFVGAIQDGMGLPSGFQFLAIKSALDLFASIAFAASFGFGVMLTGLTVLVVQGGLALLGWSLLMMLGDPALVASVGSNPLISEMTAAGGIMLIGLGLVLLDIRKPRIANFLPALVIAPAIVALAGYLGIPVYPL